MPTDFEQLQHRVLEDPALLKELYAITEFTLFAQRVLVIAAEMGLKITLAEINEARRLRHIEWFERATAL